MGCECVGERRQVTRGAGAIGTRKSLSALWGGWHPWGSSIRQKVLAGTPGFLGREGDVRKQGRLNVRACARVQRRPSLVKIIVAEICVGEVFRQLLHVVQCEDADAVRRTLHTVCQELLLQHDAETDGRRTKAAEIAAEFRTTP
jgi:hypothetical protein